MTDRKELLRGTVEALEKQRNFPYSPERRTEWETALNEAKKMYEAELTERRKNVRKKV